MAVDHTCQASVQNPSFERGVFEAVLQFHFIPVLHRVYQFSSLLFKNLTVASAECFLVFISCFCLIFTDENRSG